MEEELMTIKESILEQMIVEGVDDPGILKCVFMAGGPGSGKSFTAMEIFGIDKKLKSSFSSFGLKSVNSDSAFEKGLKDNGIDPKDLAKIEREDAELWNKISNDDDSIRNNAKRITKLQKKFYEAGRLGMIIDGTGHQYGKIQKNKKYAESLGYDTYMVFVNTSLEVAQERNKQRERVLDDARLEKSWKDVQNNLGKFQNLFGGNFRIVDNTVYKPISNQVQKAVNAFVRKPLYNMIGKKWISTARALKNKNFIK
jgi:predicted kinase